VSAPKAKPVVATLALLGVSALAAGSFAYFGLDGVARRNDLDGCKGHCDARLVDDAFYRFVAADISLGISALSLGLASFLWFRNSGTESKVTALRPLEVHF
jgi:hypothetical protein